MTKLQIVQAQLLFLESADASRYSDLFEFSWRKCLCRIRIYDTMQYIKPDVATICTGMAASMGAVLLCAGAPGKRSACHIQSNDSPTIRSSRVATDMEINLREMLKLKDELYKIISQHSGQTLIKSTKIARDYWMIAEEAKRIRND
jgi:ATP-dependent Clp protease protease subunit